MTEHERALVNAYNRFFESDDNNFDGIAYRQKQSRFTSQLCDVTVDSEYPCLYQAIECKSIKEKKNNKLYFSQHFSESEQGHQVERISDFIDRSGRAGYLALELKRGRGRQRKAYLIKWPIVRDFYEDGKVGLRLDNLPEHGYELKRDGSEYVITPELVAWLQNDRNIYG